MSWSTLKCGQHEGRAFKTAEDALNYLYSDTVKQIMEEKGYSATCFLYNSNEKKLHEEVKKVYEGIKEHNTHIEDINKQMLPPYPYYWDDMDHGLYVKACEISMNYYEKNAGCLAMFTGGYNYSVLTDPSKIKPLSTKALTTLAMMGSMMNGKS